MNRPAAVTVLGVLNILFGVWRIFSALGAFALLGVHEKTAEIYRLPLYSSWVYSVTLFGVIAGAALLTAGIGFFGLKSWARVTAILYSVGSIIFALASVVVMAVMAAPIIQANAQHNDYIMAFGELVSAISNSVFSIIYAAILLAFMFVPLVVDAFRNAAMISRSDDVPPPLPIV